MRKALLKFTPLEHAYSDMFGVMPDRHYEKLLAEKCDKYNDNKDSCIKCSLCPCKHYDDCGTIVNKNMCIVWQELKEKHEPVDTFVAAKNTPF